MNALTRKRREPLTAAQKKAMLERAWEERRRDDDEMDGNVQAMIPAAPGTYLLEWSDGEVLRSNVIAWVIAGKSGMLVPITGTCGWVSQANDDAAKDGAIVLMPDGRVETFPDAWESEAEWAKAMAFRAKKKEAGT